MKKQSVLQILEDQLDYLKTNNYCSYDLCDITSQPYFLRIDKWSCNKSYGKYIKYPHNILLDRFTPFLRKAYRVTKRDFAQSNAFIVRGLMRLYQFTGQDDYRTEALSLINRIIEQKSPGYKHACWGQPYDWFSKQVIPAYTPRTTVTSQVGRMFLDAYETTKEPGCLEQAKDIGDFFLEEMPLSFNENSKTCYSYTPIDQHQVHNPNMMACGFLSMLYYYTKEEKYLDRAISAANFTFSEIRSDGSWHYAKLAANKPSKIDNYHTGYNLEGALLLRKYTGQNFLWTDELKSAITYYKNNLFDEQGVPYLTNKKRFPIDIQCCAQSIITHSFLSELDKANSSSATSLYKWTIDHMYANGSYYYRTFKNGSIDKTDYIRWGDAWMFFAGSLLLTHD